MPVSLTPSDLRGQVAVVGASALVSPDGMLSGSVRGLEARAIRAALADAGLTLADVDGLAAVTGGMHPAMELAEYLGIAPVWLDSTDIGGSSFETHVAHAAAALAFGLCSVAVVTYCNTPRSARKRGETLVIGRSAGVTPISEWESSYGPLRPVSSYALAASRHFAEYGTTSQQLAQIAVDTRRWAEMNPDAFRQAPLTLDEVMASPVDASPLHRLDCCLVTDGAGAIVLTRADRARSLARPPVYVLGLGTCTTHEMISEMPDLTRTGGVRSGELAYAMAGLGPAEIDVRELYDSFTITVLLALEDLGFCKKGEGGPLAASGALGPGGSLPTNTSGGGLSYTHPGMFGLFLIVESVRQLRGESGPRQVPGASTAIAHGCGMVLSSVSTLILGTEATL